MKSDRSAFTLMFARNTGLTNDISLKIGNMHSTPHPATVLAIDDDPDILRYLSEILTSMGYAIRTCPAGRQALESAKLNPPDLILLDINMPDMNGYEVCGMFKSNPILRHVPVIFLSAFVDIAEKIKAFECGCVDYITKPFSVEEVIARIEIHLKLARVELLENEIARRKKIERQYYAQLEHLSDAIIHVTREGVIVYCNPSVQTLFDYTPHELTGQAVEILIPEEDAGSHFFHREKYFKSPATGLMSNTRTVYARKKHGEIFPVDINLGTLYSEEGLLVSAEIRDISEQLQLKKQLEQQRIFLDDAFSKTTDGLILADDEGMILMTNPAIVNMSGYAPEELIGKDSLFLYDSKEECQKVSSLTKKSTGEAANKPCIVNCRRKDKAVFQAEIIVIPIRDGLGTSKRCIYIIRDISDRVQLEQEYKSLARQLLQTQKMEALGQLTGGVAHDFNNILASMMGFTELATELVEDEPELDKREVKAKLTDYLAEIQTSGWRAQTLIEQMLTFSRSGNNGTLISLDISVLVNEAIKMLRPVLPASISIHAYIKDDTPRVMADPVQVHQILMNICINARDAMRGRGHIDIILGELSISNTICASCQKPVAGKYLELAIKDTGPGIDAKVVERLFEPFFTTKRVGKGTGMGLAMAHGIIHHHNGHILVESAPGQGSTFRILFPLIPATVDSEACIHPEEYAEPV